MTKTAYILSSLALAVILIPHSAMGGSVNSPDYRGKSRPKSNKVQYIRPQGTPKRRRAVTPYGDFCTRCSKYGIGSKPVDMQEAIAAIRHYFKTKGLNVKGIKGRGRFLKAEIYKGDLLVDRVLFDRRTGRIRSIY